MLISASPPQHSAAFRLLPACPRKTKSQEQPEELCWENEQCKKAG